MSASTLLDRLQGVRQTGPGRWMAKCPAHEDRSPSLSVRELDDGRVLVHDFAGCETQAVLDAVGLGMADLFERPLSGTGPAGGYGPTHSRIPAADALRAIDRELTAACLIIARAAQHQLDEGDLARLRQAAVRLWAAHDLCCSPEVRRG